MTPATKRPRKQPKPKRLSKKAKLDIIIDTMIDNPGEVHRKGFATAVSKMFKAQYGVHVNLSYTCRLIKEVKELLSKQQSHLYSKREYILKYDRLCRLLKKAQDKAAENGQVDKIGQLVGAERQIIKEQMAAEGHLADRDGGDKGDEELSKELEKFFIEKREAKIELKKKPKRRARSVVPKPPEKPVEEKPAEEEGGY